MHVKNHMHRFLQTNAMCVGGIVLAFVLRKYLHVFYILSTFFW
jgi:hypothetical protein